MDMIFSRRNFFSWWKGKEFIICWFTCASVGCNIFMGHFKVNSKFLLRLWFLGHFLFPRSSEIFPLSEKEVKFIYKDIGNSYITFFWIRLLLQHRAKEMNLSIFLVGSDYRLNNSEDSSLCRIYFTVSKDLSITIFLPYFEVFFH